MMENFNKMIRKMTLIDIQFIKASAFLLGLVIGAYFHQYIMPC